jgi:hypothetical protein
MKPIEILQSLVNTLNTRPLNKLELELLNKTVSDMAKGD